MFPHSFRTFTCVEAPKSFPAVFARGNHRITVYRTTSRGYDEFKIPYVEGGKRKFHRFAGWELAAKKKDEMLAQFLGGHSEAVTLTNTDKLIYLRARKALEPVGLPLDRVVEDFANYWKKLGGDHFKDAVDQYVERQTTIKPITVSELVELFIQRKAKATKAGRPASAKYLKDLTGRLRKFGAAISTTASAVTPGVVKAFLHSLEVGERTRFNYGRLIGTLFEFAKAERLYPRDLDPLEGLDLGFDDAGEIEIFAPDEFARMMRVAKKGMVPYLAIAAFAGLRAAEIQRLDWSDVDLERGMIKVAKAKSKTRARRIVPVQPNLKAWLEPCSKSVGPIIEFTSISKQLIGLVAAANAQQLSEAESPLAGPPPRLEWRHNALRHSFVTYRLAATQQIGQTALEAGHSEAMLFANYRELATPEEATKWFSICPGVKPVGPTEVTLALKPERIELPG